MVRPLYPPRPKKNAKPEADTALWKNPYILGIAGGLCILVLIIGLHIRNTRRILDPAQLRPSDTEKPGFFSFLDRSKVWRSGNTALSQQEEQLASLGIPTGTHDLTPRIQEETMRDRTRMFALRKYEGVQQLAKEREYEREERDRMLHSPTAGRLKDALQSLQSMDNLGIMRIEGILQEELLRSGGKRENLDFLIHAYQSLATVYEQKNMRDKAKSSIVSAFKLMKEKAPDEQGPQWDDAISELERTLTKSPGH